MHTVSDLSRNLLKLYRRALPVDIELGTAWYPLAHRIMVEWSDTYGYSIATVACVTAAISPQVDWARNLIIADDILAGRPASVGGAYNSNLRKAERIRDDRACQMLPYFPSGPKVASFACNLAGDYAIVTVDTHALQAALNDVQSRLALTWTRYAVFAEAYQQAARKAGIEPAFFQAIIWHVWKRLHPRVSKIQARRQWHVMGEY